MKKLTAILLVLVTVLTLAACGKTETAENEITDLVKQGYTCMSSSYDETQWRGIFMKDDSLDVIYKVVASMTAKKYEALSGLGWDDEKYEEKELAILGSLTDVVVTNIADKIPSQEEINAYVGKTVGDMEDDGFENTGWTEDPDLGYILYYDGPVYYCRVTPAEKITDMDDYSANDIRALEIASVEFMGVSDGLLED